MSVPLILFKTRKPLSVPLAEQERLQLPSNFTFDQSRLREANAIVFHIPEWSWSRSTFEETLKFPGQIWIAWSKESKVHYGKLADRTFMRRFDLRMTYEQDADIWTPYLPRLPTWQSLQSSPVPVKTENSPTALFQSDPIDRSGRNAFSSELMRYTKVDSYGRFLNTRSVPMPDLGGSTKRAVISRHHFCLALENSIAPDYVTEKIFDPLMAGTVPVYRGAPNFREFVPEGSFIDATAFDRPKNLADYLHHLVATPTDYAAFFAWRSRPLPQWIRQRTARIEPELLLRLQQITSMQLEKARPRRTPRYPFGLAAKLRAQASKLKRTLRGSAPARVS